MHKIALWFFSFKLVFCSCNTDNTASGFLTRSGQDYHICQIGKMPPQVPESSGIVFNQDSTCWTHNDGGNASALYQINTQGKLLATLGLPKLPNYDWEDLSTDNLGNLYIGDFGNNRNDRRELFIYKLNPKNPLRIDTIKFSYADQKAFPPIKPEKNFDCEAFFWLKGSLYLFSKNRGDKKVKYYKIPDQAGTYRIAPEKSIYLQASITGASVSPKKDKFVLLGYGKMYFFKIIDEKNLFSKPYLCLKLARGQTEAIAFIDDKHLLITNEKGKIFLLTLKAN
jgi:hypothetical protein